MAALLYAGHGSLLTGAAALRGQGIASSAPGLLDLLVPASRQPRSAAFAAIHPTTRMPERFVAVGRRCYAPAPRAIADAARWLTDLGEVRALVASAVQKGWCPLSLLVAELDSGPVKGSALLRRVLDEVADGARSGAEADLMDLIRRGRLPIPLYNARLYAADGTLIAIPDAWWPEAGVAAEVDSKEWHLSPADWERTMDRHDRMSGYGIIVVHFSPRRLRTDPVGVTAAIARALTAGRARPSLPIRAGLAS